MSIFKTNEDVLQIMNSIRTRPNNKRLSDKELKKKINGIFGGSLKKFKEYVGENFVDMTNASPKPQSFYWIAVMDKAFGEIKTKEVFNCYNWDNVFKRVMDVLFDEVGMDVRIQKIEKYLEGKGIVLRNSEFVPGSNINSCSFKKDGQVYLFMNDKRKREYQYIYVLIKELELLYTGRNDNTDDLIREYEEEFNKSHVELDLAMKIFESDELVEMKWELLRVQTHKRINFQSDEIGF